MKTAVQTLLLLVWPLFFSCENQQKKKSGITFSEHIAPLIHANCTPCHRPGSAGPFSLITYHDVLRKAKTIKLVTGIRLMPPWPADRNYSNFVGEKGLSEQQIEMIAEWVDNGCPVGDSTRIPAPPHFPQGSFLGTPDKVVKMPTPFPIKGDNKDKFLLMKFPYELERDTFIRAIEFVAGNKKVVHHVNGFLIQYEEGKKKNIYEGDFYADTEQMNYPEAYEKMKLAHDDGTYPALTSSAVNYLPGVLPNLYPEGIGGLVVKKKGAIFLKDIHYGPSPKDDTDTSYFNIFFAKKKPQRPLLELQMGTLGVSEIVPPLVIPPNEVKTFKTQVAITKDISLITINPHMHLLGKSFWAFAVKPGGDTIPLIKIPQWDFRWQYFYTFKKPVKIPAGSVIQAIGVYDNTVNNPRNPFNPPQTVSERQGSMRTTDEMFQFIINYVLYREGDETISLEGAELNR